ncbi:MAG: 2-dehydropantoate 2-reductase [Alphaproteobacteria bacterium]|nr:2-dehydropantoate 2-reductase [Alphaproteobacteria bacterium]
MGSGGVGGYFGARLAANGEDVTFIARGLHLEAIRGGGLKVESRLGDLHIHPAKATEDPAEIGPVDYVLFSVKLWDTERAGEAIRPLIGPETAVISLQNGIDPEETLCAILGPDHVMGGVARIAAVIAAPGVIRHTGEMAGVDFGELDNARTARAERLLDALVGAGVDSTLADDIVKAIWQKFVLLAAFSALTSLTRLPIGSLRSDPDTRTLLTELMRENAAVAAARGTDLGAGIVERLVAVVDGFPDDMTSSMAQDLIRGNRLELEWLAGAVVRMGRELDVPTPVNGFIRTALKHHAEGSETDERRP